MYSSNRSAEVDKVYLHDISNSNPTLMENHFGAKTCIDDDNFNPGKWLHSIWLFLKSDIYLSNYEISLN